VNTGNIIPAMMGAFGLLFLLLLFILIIIWIVLPFSVFGIKELVREAIEEQKKTNELLKDILGKKPPAGTEETKKGECEDVL